MCITHKCQCVLHIFLYNSDMKITTYGQNFRHLRKAANLTQKEVADHLHIYQSNISDWENDISRPDYETLIKLSHLYSATLYELLEVNETSFKK